ncbi:MAG: response regulator [Candidatus Tectimicrobiota bacterium]
MPYGPLLIVEDSDEDFYTITRALGDGMPCAIVRCSSGQEAMEYLEGRGPYARAARPSLMFLDLNLPGRDGRQVLAAMQQSPALRVIPVVVVSTSTNPGDITQCYQSGASGYVRKAMVYREFVRVLQTIRAYWYSAVLLPEV